MNEEEKEEYNESLQQNPLEGFEFEVLDAYFASRSQELARVSLVIATRPNTRPLTTFMMSFCLSTTSQCNSSWSISETVATALRQLSMARYDGRFGAICAS